MRSWRQHQKEKLKQLLYDTALVFFRKQGYENTTVQQITEAAQVAKGTFFNHFPTKEHVVAQWYRQITFDVLEKLKALNFHSSRQAIGTLVNDLATRSAADPVLFNIKTQHVIASDFLSDEERFLDAQLMDFCLQHIKEGKACNEISKQLNESFFSSMILTVLTGTTREWVISHHGFDLCQTLDERISFLFEAAKSKDCPTLSTRNL
jgi:AcrR family transcriptional regulator